MAGFSMCNDKLEKKLLYSDSISENELVIKATLANLLEKHPKLQV